MDGAVAAGKFADVCTSLFRSMDVRWVGTGAGIMLPCEWVGWELFLVVLGLRGLVTVVVDGLGGGGASG